MSSIVHGGLPAGMSGKDLIDIVARLRAALGLQPEDVEYLRHMLIRVRREDFAAGRICAVWLSARRVSDLMGYCARKICRIETRLEQSGLIRRSALANGRRYGERDQSNRIISAGGIDLGPLIQRAEQLHAMATAQAQRDEELHELRREAQRLARCLRGAGEEVLEAAREVLPRMRPSELTDPSRLEAVIAAWEAILADLGQTVQPARSDRFDRPITDKEMISETWSAAPERAEPERPAALQTTPAQVWLVAGSALREAIAFYAEAFSPDWRGSGQPCWQAIQHAARDIALQSGVSGADWDAAARLLGADRAALCVAVVSANLGRDDRWSVNEPAPALKGLWRSEWRGGSALRRLVAARLKRPHA